MIRGLDTFRERFRGYEDSLVLIGGAACDNWFTRQGLEFRPTKDLDIVLLLEAVDARFISALHKFINDGGYEIRQRSEGGSPILYRFEKPTDKSYPHMLEIFSRAPEGVELIEDQSVTPIPAGESEHSLSAILVDDVYHELIRMHSESNDGVSFANATALIPLKAKAWLNMQDDLDRGKPVKAKDIKKHRADVFRIAGTLPGTTGPELPAEIKADLNRFLDAFPETAQDWSAILASIKATLGSGIKPTVLIDAIQTYFSL